MKDGYIEQSDADTLMRIYEKINVVNGLVNEPLTISEAVLIYAIAKSIKEGKIKGLQNEDKTEKPKDILTGKARKCPLCHNFMVDEFGVSANYCENCSREKLTREGKVGVIKG